MRILLTGAGGFIGSFVCRDLLLAGHDVAILSRSAAPWRLASVIGRLKVIEGDLAALDTCADAICHQEPDAVAHLAWHGVGNGDRERFDQVRNIGWTADLVQLARQAGASVFLGVGSQAEYGPQAVPLGPDSDTKPTALYGEAKLVAGRIADRMANTMGLRFVWMRVFSTFGPTDHPYWMIPNLVGALLRQERPALTLGHQAWDFLHVEDAARAIRLALECEDARGIYTLGSGLAPTLRSTVEAIRDHIDPKLVLGFGDVAYRPDQVMLLQADISALRRDLGWEPRIDLLSGLSGTVDWYKANRWIFDGGPAPR